MSRLTRDGTAEPVSRDQILRHARGQGNVHFPCSADHEQDWQPYPVDPYSAICDDHTYIHTYPRHNVTNCNLVVWCTCIAIDVVSVQNNLVQKYCIITGLLLFWCPYMVIYVSVQCNGGLLPDIILLTLCD